MTATTVISYIIILAIPIFVIYVLQAVDLFQTTKRNVLLFSLGWGVVAFGLAYVVNNTILSLLVNQAGLDRGEALDLIRRFIAPLAEETLKALFLIYLIFQPTFRYPVDGAVYGFCIGIGFAVVENIFYVNNSPNVTLSLAITRSLSTALMHGTATALVGLGLGRLRRTKNRFPVFAVVGIAAAYAAHIVYNNLVNSVDGAILLLLAIGFGIFGVVFIAYQMKAFLRDEKARMALALSAQGEAAVGEGEVRSIQRMGEMSSGMLNQLSESVGDENVALIRKLLITQANIGILKNNLSSGATSPRLRKAWEDEVAEREKEFLTIRKQLKGSVMSYFQSVFQSEDESMWKWIVDDLAKTDPTMIHTFDMFLFTTGVAAELTPEYIEEMALRLKKIEIFREVDLANLENLGRSIKSVEFQPGDMMFDQGDVGEAMYLIESGGIDIFAVSNGTETFLRTFQPGQVVGDFAVLDGQPRSARARASAGMPLVTLELKRVRFKMFIQSRPQVIFAVLKVLGEKARFTTSTVEENVRTLRNLAQGNYADVMAKAKPAAEAVQTAESTVVTAGAAAEGSDSDVSAAVGRQLSETFAKLASTLQQNAPAPRSAGQGAN